MMKKILRVFTCIVGLLILAVMPLYFQEGYTHIGSDKSYFYRACIVRLGAWILLFWLLRVSVCAVRVMARRDGKAWERLAGDLSVTDRFALGYGISAALSYLCSRYKGTALWGTRGWYMGLIPQLAFVAVYFLLSRFQFPRLARWMAGLILPISAAVFALGYLNRFDVWPIPMANSGIPTFISTVGNINWYCGYAVTAGFLGVGLFWLEQGGPKWRAALLGGYVFLFFAALITQGSDSGLFALAAVFFAMFYFSVRDGERERMKRFWMLAMLLAAAGTATMGLRLLFPGRMNYTSALGDLLTFSPLSPAGLAIAWAGLAWTCSPKGFRPHAPGARRLCAALLAGLLSAIAVYVGMTALNTLRPGSLGPLSDEAAFTFNDRWASSRGGAWKLGGSCFLEQDALHRLTGVGPDCMADYLYSGDGSGNGASEELMARTREVFSKRLTNAHCEFLTALVNLGLLGMVSLAGMLVSAAVRFLRARKRGRFAAACGLCVLAYMANNVWSFQQALSLATMGAVLGLGEWFARRDADSHY